MADLFQGQETPKPIPAVPNLLRPQQVLDNQDEAKRIEYTLKQPNIQDPGLATRQLRNIRESLERFTPRPYDAASVDEAARQEETLRAEIVDGMCTQEEMRRCPPGAVDKHRKWEAKNKAKILAWKHLVLRLNAGTDDRDVANIEKLRPKGGSMNMDNAVVPVQTTYQLPPAGAAPPTVFNEQEVQAVAGLDLELAGQLALLDNDQRAKVKDIIRDLTQPSMTDLHAQAKKLGIQSGQKSRAFLIEAIAAKE